MIDSNGNGKICASELARAARVLGYNPTSKEVDQMIASVDQDCKNRVSEFDFGQD